MTSTTADTPGRARRPGRRVAADVLLWAVFCLPSVLLAPGGRAEWWQLAGGAGVLGVAVAVRQTFPRVALGLCAALWWAVAVPGGDLGEVVVSPYLPAVFGLSFALGRRAAVPQRRYPWAVPAVAVAAALAGAAGTGAGPAAWAVLATALIFACLLPWLVGRYVRQRDELQHAGWEHARQVELRQRGSVERARLRERARIAEDMHDSLGHELNLIALRAGAMQVAPGLDEHFREAAGELRVGASDALERLREIIGVLREDDAPTRLDPAAADLDGLVQRARASGLPVELTRSGGPWTLPEMADRAVYRVVQESLTNAMKHAPGGTAAVRLDGSDGGVTVTVRSTRPPGPLPVPVPPPADPADPVRGGHGLTGLAERVRLTGGGFRAGPLPDGGFEVVARLPRDGAGAGGGPEAGASARAGGGGGGGG
ncbi:sensor histidine kinase, partial [Kitasatospora phosalacinea]|uniref:sensor histidine kinase n=1 Tax=Kitasatospora phosalacinea TaxID=2065 RepID=UPI003657DEC9